MFKLSKQSFQEGAHTQTIPASRCDSSDSYDVLWLFRGIVSEGYRTAPIYSFNSLENLSLRKSFAYLLTQKLERAKRREGRNNMLTNQGLFKSGDTVHYIIDNVFNIAHISLNRKNPLNLTETNHSTDSDMGGGEE